MPIDPAKYYFRVQLNGNHADLDSLEDAFEFIRKKWTFKGNFTDYCTIRLMSRDGGVVGFVIQQK